MSVLRNPDYQFQMEYPADWTSQINKKTNMIGYRDLALLNYDKLTDSNTEVWLQVLSNENRRPPPACQPDETRKLS